MMAPVSQCVILVVGICLVVPTEAFSPSGLALGGGRTKRNVHCTEELEYRSNNICCTNCPAGTHLVSPCTTAKTKGQCVECEDGTFTEHSNSLHLCLKCTPCHPGQEIVRQCTHTSDTVCQCKPGKFCEPDQACEECRKCSKCEEDEEIVRNCTPTSNTECKKTQLKSNSSAAVVAAVLVPAILIGIVVLVVACVKYRGPRTNQSDGQKPGSSNSEEGRTGDPQRWAYQGLMLSQKLVRPNSAQPRTEDECRVLCESLNSSASNSQHSLTGIHVCGFLAPLSQPSPMVSRQPDERDDEQFPELVPVDVSAGEESLRRCFDLFEEMDMDYYRRFFRRLGISDNVIKSKDSLPYDDRIHELLNIWVEREGKEASINDLLKELLVLNQRRTAENIKEHAIRNRWYVCKEDNIFS